MKNRLVCSFFCLAVVTFVAPACGQDGLGDAIFPEAPQKLEFLHHDNPIISVPWIWHPEDDGTTGDLTRFEHIAGLKFTIKYDPYEVAIRGIRPAFPDSGYESSIPGFPGFSGHLRHSTIIDWGDSEPTFGPFPQGDLPSEVQGTVWVNTDIANNSGLFIQPSHGWQFMNVDIEPRHTSNYQLNSDIDIVVSNLQPIYHLTQGRSTLLNSVWVPHHVTPLDPQYPELEESTRVWEHKNDYPGIPIPNSVHYFRGPLVSTLETNPDNPDFPKSGLHGAHIEESDYLHVDDTGPVPPVITTPGGGVITLVPSELYHAGPEDPTNPNAIPLPELVSHSFATVVLHASDFTVGLPVGTSLNHFGIGIDHIPEPASLTLLGLGAVAALMRLKVQRRRRRAA